MRLRHEQRQAALSNEDRGPRGNAPEKFQNAKAISSDQYFNRGHAVSAIRPNFLQHHIENFFQFEVKDAAFSHEIVNRTAH